MPLRVTRSSNYAAAVEALAGNPIVQAMASDLAAAPDHVRAAFFREDGSPTFEFMTFANAGYAALGGTHGRFIGTVAEAIARHLATLETAEPATA